MWVLGGSDAPGSNLNDVWHSTDGSNWEQVTASADWVSRLNHTSLVYDNRMWVLGGSTGFRYLNDVWYSRDGSNWEQATASADWPIRQLHASLVYDNKMWVLSGNEAPQKSEQYYLV